MSGVRYGTDVPVQFAGVTTFARMVGATPSTVREWIRRGMPAVRVDRHWRIDVAGAVRWMRKAHRRG